MSKIIIIALSIALFICCMQNESIRIENRGEIRRHLAKPHVDVKSLESQFIILYGKIKDHKESIHYGRENASTQR